MRKLIIIIVCITMGVNVFAQYLAPSNISIDKYQVLDSAYLKVTYKLTSIKDTLKAEQTRRDDIQILLVGKKISKYFSQNMIDYNEDVRILIKKGTQTIPSAAKEGTYGYEIFKNHPYGKTTVTDLGVSMGGSYLYEDEMEDLKWEIKKETSTILSYSCQKATTRFRGRVYEAWFTTDIPSNNGPWKFGGLPGLIMKVSDLQQYFVFESVGLERLKVKEPIKYFNLEYIKISRQNLDKLYRRFHNDQAAYNLSQGIRTMEMNPNTRKGTVVKNSTKKLPYNPIERE